MIPRRLSAAFATLRKGRLLFLFAFSVILPSLPLVYFASRTLQSIAAEPAQVAETVNGRLQALAGSLAAAAGQPALACLDALAHRARPGMPFVELADGIGQAERACAAIEGFFILDGDLRPVFPFPSPVEEWRIDIPIGGRTDERLVEFSRRMKAGSRREFIEGDPAGAVGEYEAAAADAGSAHARAVALAAAARCSMKAGRYAEAARIGREGLTGLSGDLLFGGLSLPLLVRYRTAAAERARGEASMAADILIGIMGGLADGGGAGSRREAAFYARMVRGEMEALAADDGLSPSQARAFEEAWRRWRRTDRTAALMEEMRQSLQADFRQILASRGGDRFRIMPGDGGTILACGLTALGGADAPVLLAVLLDGEALREEMLEALRASFDPGWDVSLTVTDGGGEIVLAEGDGPRSRFEARRPLGPALPLWTLSLAYRSDGPLLLGEVKERRTWLTYMALLASIVLLGLSVSYRSIRKDHEIARLKSDFVSRVSHELRTPLATIRAVGEMLELGAVSSREREKEYFSFITSESERLSRLIENVLDFSRIGAGKRTYQIRPVPLARTVAATVSAFRQYVTAEGFEINFRAAGDIGEVPADEDAVSQALINLMDNAVKFSRDDKTIWVELGRDGGEITLAVRDRGIGIDRKDLERIFSMFYRHDGAEGTARKGAGIGLSIVKSVAEAHGGRVEVRSVPGEGSTFTIVLPAR
ncbi:MAG: HAMP domain-containing sensor histidine kinase [bacterium]|nr:HAMP domain-containing sensor histidine kinase [bacterium]